MRDSHLDWIWSRYRTSPDASSGMQSLYRTCSVFTELVLQPSHIILRGGGFTLHPELAIPLTDIVTSMDRLLLLAAKHNRLPQAPYIGRQELSILTASESLHSCATQNQIVFNWVLLIDRLALAMRELQWLCIGDDPTRHGWTSWMPGILASLPPSLRIKLPRDFLESYGITVLPPAANTSEAVNQTAAALRHAEVVSCRLTGRSHVALDDVEAEGFAVAARSPNSSSAVAKATEDLAHLDRATSMSNLIDRFTRYPTPAISLLARTTCIVKSKSLSSVEITDRGIDSALGRFALEIGFFRRVNDATNAMQSILTEASSLARIRDKCFVVDPHGALMRMLRGTNTTGELQAAWRSLSERMYVSQGRLAEYEHYGEKAGNTPANERHESAPQLPVPTSARSRLVPSNVTDIEVICPRGSRVESHESQAPAHIDGSAALPIVSRTVVELGGLHVEMGETLARVSIVKREELHGRIAELHTTTGGRNLEQVSALDIQVADAKGGHILVPVLERGGLDADTCENQQTKYSPEEQRTLATQPSVGQAHPVILLYTSSSRLRLTLSRSFVVDSKARVQSPRGARAVSGMGAGRDRHCSLDLLTSRRGRARTQLELSTRLQMARQHDLGDVSIESRYENPYTKLQIFFLFCVILPIFQFGSFLTHRDLDPGATRGGGISRHWIVESTLQQPCSTQGLRVAASRCFRVFQPSSSTGDRIRSGSGYAGRVLA